MLLRVILLIVGLTDYIASSQNLSTRNDFDWKLFKTIIAEKEGNVVLSTFSVRAVLSVLHGGAGGNTAVQLEKALDLRSGYNIHTNIVQFAAQFRSLTVDGKDYELHVATKIYTAPDFKHKEKFRRLINIIHATVEKLDFQNPSEAAAQINQWVSKVTNGRIANLVSEESTREDTRMLLLNAIYFKGRWLNPFPPKDTLPGTFYVNDQNSITADFMKIVTPLKHVVSDDLGAYVVRLPYAGDRFAMNVIVPKEKNGLKGLIRNMSPQIMKGLEDQMQEGTVTLKLPKFHFDFTSALVPALQQLGIVDIFGSKANLSEIAENYQDLYVSNMIQKAGVDVNEVGTTAYGATEVELVSKFGEDILEVTADHPFVFYIQDIPTYTVVFLGTVTDPTSSISEKPSGSSLQKPTGSTGQQPSAQVTQRPGRRHK